MPEIKIGAKVPGIARWLFFAVLLFAFDACVVGGGKCKTGADCPPPFSVCVNQECVICRVDPDCKGGLVCRDGTCVPSSLKEPTTDASSEAPTQPDTPTSDATKSDNSAPERTNADNPISNDNGTRETSDAASNDATVLVDNGGADNTCTAGNKRSCFPADPKRLGVGLCKAGIQVCDAAGTWDPKCSGVVLPSKEVCNGKDDDCDGTVDNGIQPTTCYSGPANTRGKAPCKSGKRSCVNGKLTACIGEVVPSVELCDDKDNDCDGRIDEDFPLKGKPCFVGRGKCQAQGVYVCGGGLYLLRCNGKPGPPASADTCGNKIDDDCDGRVDEGNCNCRTVGVKIACGSRVGACQMGTQICRRVTILGTTTIRWGGCTNPVSSGPEKCDGIDNDCDGDVDEDCCLPTALSYKWSAHTSKVAKRVVGIYLDKSRDTAITASAGNNAKVWKWTEKAATQDKSLLNQSGLTAMTIDREKRRYYVFALDTFAIAVWERDQKIRNTLTGHTARINALSISKDGKTIASVSNDKSLRIWLADRGQSRSSVTYAAAMKAVAFAEHDREVLAAGGMDNNIYILNAEDDNIRQQRILKGHTGGVIGLQWQKDGKVLYSLSLDRTVRSWDPTKTTPTATLYTAPSSLTPLGFSLSADGGFIALVYKGASANIKIWDVGQSKMRASFTLPNASGAVTWSEDRKQLLVGDEGGVIHVYKCP